MLKYDEFLFKSIIFSNWSINFFFIYIHLAMPILLSYEEELIKMQQLSEENEILKKRVSSL